MSVRQPKFLLLAAMAAATPAVGQTVAPAAGTAASATQGAASVPDFSGIWWHPSLPGFEPPASGPGPVTNRSRRDGISDYNQLVGDYTNPILKPEAAEVVKKHGELSLAGVTYPNPANQVLARAGAVHLQEFRAADIAAAGQAHDALRAGS